MKSLILLLYLASPLQASYPDIITDPNIKEVLDYLDGKVSAASTNLGYMGMPIGSTVTTNTPFVQKSGDSMSGTLSAPLFVGPLTGAASLNVLKSGDTMTGPLVVNSSVTAYYGLFTDNNAPLTYPTVAGVGGTTTSYVSEGVTYIVHKFISSANFTPPSGLSAANVLLVGGGGSAVYDVGGSAMSYGGGGGGEVSEVTIAISGTMPVVVGEGGSTGTRVGKTSSFGGVTVSGGGYGADVGQTGGDGASGGGGVGYPAATLGGTGTVGGHGGNGFEGYSGGGGGGAGHVDGTSGTSAQGGLGGNGAVSVITGSLEYYGGGGGGGGVSGVLGGNGGLGGGGQGYPSGNTGTANTGGGGGGAYNGGSGVVIISYPLGVPVSYDVIYASGSVHINNNLTVVGKTVISGNLYAPDFISTGGSLNAVIISTGVINANLQSYKTTVQVSTASIYSALQSTSSALASEISRATTRENDIGISTGTIQNSLNAVVISTGVLQTDLATEVSGRQQADLAIGIETGTLRTDFTVLALSTGPLVNYPDWNDTASSRTYWNAAAAGGEPLFTASASSQIVVSSITHWNTAYGWGDWSGQGFITSTETVTADEVSLHKNNHIFSAISSSVTLQGNTYKFTDYLPLTGGTLTGGLSVGVNFSVGGSTFIVTGGKVGIGTTTPDNKLDIYAAGQGLSSVKIKSDQATNWDNATGGALGSLNFGTDGSGSGVATVGTIKGFAVNAGYQLRAGTLDYFDTLNIGGGKVGIGTTLPNFPLVVNGASGRVQIDQSVGLPTLGFSNGEYTGAVPTYNTRIMNTVMGGTSASLRFIIGTTAGAETTVMTLEGTGNVGIGTTSPAHLLTLAGGAYCDGTGAWVAGSDRSYKKSITPLTYGLNEILKLIPIKFIHKQDKKGLVQIGLIANDVKPIIPEVVEGKEGSYGLAYERIIPVMVNAFKEQQKMITDLQNRIETLEKK